MYFCEVSIKYIQIPKAMAQIREFTSTNASYFILDGVKYPKSYEAVDDSSLNDNRLKVIPIGRTGEQLVFSTHYRNVSVNGSRFNSLEEAISAINEVVFSKGGGSGDGGTIEGIVTEDTNTVNFTGNGKVGSPLKADNIDIYSTTETKTGGTWIDGKPIYRKVFILPESDFLTGGLLELDLSSLNINKVLPNSEASYKYVDTGISKETKFRNIIDSTTFEVWDYFYSDNMLSVIMASNGVKIPHFTEVTFILEYTKTT